MQFDSTLNDTVSSIELNSKYIKTMPDEVRAAVGFIATFIGNECTWDGKYSENRSNLKCRILTALNLGYQCSSKHLGFLRSKFAKDSAVLAQLNPGNCPTTPDGATIENTFDSITIIRYLDTIELQYAVSSVNLREGFYSNWTEQALFKYRSGSVFLISKLKSRLKQQLIKLEK